MQKYKDYAPTGFDTRGLSADENGITDWLVLPCGRNRDSGLLDESNFTAALELIGGEGEDCQVHRFGHWACGWFELILVRPASKAHEAAAGIVARLENYPVLDEEDYGRRQYDSVVEYWAQCSVGERVELCRRARVNVFASRREDEIPDRVFDRLLEHAN